MNAVCVGVAVLFDFCFVFEAMQLLVASRWLDFRISLSNFKIDILAVKLRTYKYNVRHCNV